MKASWTKEKEIEVVLDTLGENKTFLLVENGVATAVLPIFKVEKKKEGFLFVLTLKEPLTLGNAYQISDEKYEKCPVDVSLASTFPLFSKYEHYRGPLGAVVHHQETDFYLWAPLCEKVVLLCDDKEYLMIREEKGIYHIHIAKNLALKEYSYRIYVSGKGKEIVDPYAKGITPDHLHGVVIEEERYCLKEEEVGVPSPMSCVIYEGHVRDLTSQKDTDIVHKGTFYGLCEEGRKTTSHHPAGIDYLSYLGIGALQLLPIHTNATVEELHRDTSYNWGYDPLSYFAYQGSFGREVGNVDQLIRDAQKMVRTLHKKNIRVILDVVFNHVYRYETTAFYALAPYYYFRRENGKMSDGSFCGNDLETRNDMVRRLILDSLLYDVKMLHVDGFRFDLMGILDLDTMAYLEKELHECYPNLLLYGEGWDMPTFLPKEKKSIIENHAFLPRVGFFNDRYREVARGSADPHRLKEKGYLLGNTWLREEMISCLYGNVLPYRQFAPRFSSFSQVIQYIECHDNCTLYDKIRSCDEAWSEKICEDVLCLVNATNLLSPGIAFFHMGQEIGQSKNGQHNTYNTGDTWNQFRYDLLGKKKHLSRYVKDVIAVRKKLDWLGMEKEELAKHCKIFPFDKGGIEIDYEDETRFDTILINPCDTTAYHAFSSDYEVLLNEAGIPTEKVYEAHAMVRPRSMKVYRKYK